MLHCIGIGYQRPLSFSFSESKRKAETIPNLTEFHGSQTDELDSPCGQGKKQGHLCRQELRRNPFQLLDIAPRNCHQALRQAVQDGFLHHVDLEFLNTKACKDMLLHPKSSAEELYKYLPLIVNIGATYRTKYYFCSLECCVGIHRLVSTVKDAPCLCGKKMVWRVPEEKGDLNADGVLIEGKIMRFMIRDDLQISVASSTKSFALLRELGISDMSGAMKEWICGMDSEFDPVLNTSYL